MSPTLRLAQELIARPSYQDPEPVLQYVVQVLDFLPWERQPLEGGQYNLLYLPQGARVVVNTHVDTVPPLTMPEAFRPRLVQGRLYGRGAVDTKGLLAALLAAAR